MSGALQMVRPQMVVCKLCGLLVGWSSVKVEMVCIPCFDKVEIRL
jgi:hypothetical protein